MRSFIPTVISALVVVVPIFSTATVIPLHKRNFQLVDNYQGQSFFDGWDFFTDPDPTHGNVVYVSQDQATSAGLAYVQEDNTVVMAVDSYSQLPLGQNRNSVRIQSQKTYDTGLIIADIFSMPHGCSVWPAFWLVGPNWPNGGEIDVVEGVHENIRNQMTLHTSSGCSLNPTPPTNALFASTGSSMAFSAQVLGTTCASSAANNDGCAFLDTGNATYGHPFNMIAGGVFATLIDSTGVRVWHFPRTNIPGDIEAQAPDPSSWGPPSAFWSASTCDPSAHFTNMSLVFDITLCGDWAGATYQSAGCPGTCQQAVTDPNNFKYAQWKVSSVRVYQ